MDLDADEDDLEKYVSEVLSSAGVVGGTPEITAPGVRPRIPSVTVGGSFEI